MPIVPLSDRNVLGFWKDCGVEAIIISFTDLLRPSVFNEVVRRGIHWFLGFDGNVILSSIMPDNLLIRDDVFRLFFKVALAGGFDAVIGWDVPVYLDTPLYYS